MPKVHRRSHRSTTGHSKQADDKPCHRLIKVRARARAARARLQHRATRGLESLQRIHNLVSIPAAREASDSHRVSINGEARKSDGGPGGGQRILQRPKVMQESFQQDSPQIRQTSKIKCNKGKVRGVGVARLSMGTSAWFL
ncbi:hypothetical protein Q5P01_016945 [Channa striata]|uniref:Uncharacterized protein n=1 Tax=Channa striata TaxID=64152 RepID=A0AA88MAC4_CHASR|nr:hypothetical protein Q5P01_016945 [Channa striata]